MDKMKESSTEQVEAQFNGGMVTFRYKIFAISVTVDDNGYCMLIAHGVSHNSTLRGTAAFIAGYLGLDKDIEPGIREVIAATIG